MSWRSLVAWLRNRDLVLLLAASFIACGIYVFVLLSDLVTAGRTQPFDEWVLLSLRKAGEPARPIGPDWMTEVGRDLTALGGITVMFLLAASVAGYLVLIGRWRMLGMLALSLGGGLALNLALKRFFERPRPEIVPYLSHVYTSSYPSGHALLSAVTYLTLGALLANVVPQKRLKTYFLALAVLLTLVVGVSRVFMGVHYPTDVLAGWAVGFLWATACWLLARLLRRNPVVPGVD